MKILIIVLALFVTQNANALKFYETGVTVSKIKLNSKFMPGGQGGCLVYVDEFIDKGKCLNNWISFNCEPNKNNDETRSYRMFDQALIASMMNKKVNIVINQAQRVDKVCVAEEITILN